MDNKLLAKRLKELRSINNYTQEYVASYLNIIRQSYSHYETGRNIPSSETLYKLATLYSISVEELFALSGENTETAGPNPAAPFQDTLSDFLDYVNDPENIKKLKLLNKKEKELLYYFQKLSQKDQEDILTFLKIKALRKP